MKGDLIYSAHERIYDGFRGVQVAGEPPLLPRGTEQRSALGCSWRAVMGNEVIMVKRAVSPGRSSGGDSAERVRMRKIAAPCMLRAPLVQNGSAEDDQVTRCRRSYALPQTTAATLISADVAVFRACRVTRRIYSRSGLHTTASLTDHCTSLTAELFHHHPHQFSSVQFFCFFHHKVQRVKKKIVTGKKSGITAA